MTSIDGSLPAHLAACPLGFADWWLSYFGGEEFTTEEERDGFTMAVIAWEACLQFSGWPPDCRATLDPDAELAAHGKTRGLLPPEQPTPHVVTV